MGNIYQISNNQTLGITEKETVKNMKIITEKVIEQERIARKYLGKEQSRFEDMVYRFNRLLIEGKIYSHLVHAEVICRNLMRDPNNILERPDFNKSDASYIILTVQKALMNNPSPLISLSFERVKDQLKKVSTFTKTKPSMIDKLYMESYNHWFNEDVFEYKCI